MRSRDAENLIATILTSGSNVRDSAGQISESELLGLQRSIPIYARKMREKETITQRRRSAWYRRILSRLTSPIRAILTFFVVLISLASCKAGAPSARRLEGVFPLLPEIFVEEAPCDAKGRAISGALHYLGHSYLLPESKGASASISLIPCPKGGEPVEIAFEQTLLPPHFDGFEAVVSVEDDLFFAIETRSPHETRAFLAKASRLGNDKQHTLTKVIEIPLRSGVDNRSVESLVYFNGSVYAIEELNFPPHNTLPAAHRFDMDLNSLGSVTFPALPYRITDASSADEHGNFWVINYLWDGDSDLFVERDPLIERWGLGEAHARNQHIERLVELRFSENGIELVDRPPLYLALIPQARNWEGLVSRPDGTFLLATDTFPRTIIATLRAP